MECVTTLLRRIALIRHLRFPRFCLRSRLLLQALSQERTFAATPIVALSDAQIRAQNDSVLSHLKTANPDKTATPDKTVSPGKAVRLWKNARLDVWEKYYGKPETITSGKEADGFNSLNDTPASYRWNINRFELVVAFVYQRGTRDKN